MMAAAALLAFASCEEGSIDPLEGVFQKPEDQTFSAATVNGFEKAATTRTFDLTVKGDSGKDLHLYLVSNQYYILPTAYTAVSADKAGKGNYIAQQSTFGGVSIETGTLTFEADSDTWTEGVNYTVSGTVWLTDGNIVRVSGTFPMAFEEDIDPNVMSDVITDMGGVSNHVISLYDATGTMTASFVLNRTAGADIEGTYTVADYYSTTADMSAWAGYDYSAWMAGMIGGSLYYDQNGALTLINSGETITVTKNPDLSYTFQVGANKFYGKYPNTAYCTDSAASEGVTLHTITVMDATGTSVAASFALNRASDAASLEGTYTVGEYQTADMTAGNGYDLSAWIPGYVGGSYYYDGDGNLVLINAGETIDVKVLGSVCKVTVGAYSISFSIASHTAAQY